MAIRPSVLTHITLCHVVLAFVAPGGRLQCLRFYLRLLALYKYFIGIDIDIELFH